MNNNLTQQNIPNGWQSFFVDDICHLMKGQGLSKKDIDPSGKNKCLLYGELFTTYDEVIENVKSRTNSTIGIPSVRGDILIPGSTTTVARDLAVASALNEEGVLLGGDINILRKKDDSYDSNFLAYYLTHYKKDEIGKLGQGSTIVHLYGSNIKALEVVIPKNIKEQQKIAEILGTVDEDIAKTQEVIEATEKLKRGLMQQLFTRGIGHTKFKETKIGQIPEEWSVNSLDEITEKISVGFVGTCEPFYTDESGIPMLRTGNLKNWGIDRNDLKFVTNDFHIKNKKSQVKSGDILIARHGENGLACLVPEDFGEANCLNVVIIRPNKETLDSTYLFYAINSPLARNQMEAKTGGSTQKVVNTSDIKLVLVGIPQKAEQKEIAEIISAVDEKISINKKLKEKLILLKKGLMQDLLSGSKRVRI